MEEETSLDRLPPDRWAVVQEVFAQGAQRRRLQELGFVPGAQVECVGISPLGDPSAYQLRGTVIALRRRDARPVRVAFLSNTGI